MSMMIDGKWTPESKNPESEKYKKDPNRVWYSGRWMTKQSIERQRKMSHKKNPTPWARNQVPIAPVMKIVDEYIYAEEFGLKPSLRNQEEYFIHLHRLACKAKVNPETLARIHRDPRRKTMNFDIADRLLCAMGLSHKWTGELSEIYYAVDLSGTSKIPLYIEPTERRACPHCGEIFTAHTISGSNDILAKFCSRSCDMKHKGRNFRPHDN